MFFFFYNVMKIIHSDFRHGEVKILVENQDDLWCLSQVIENSDNIKGKTLRKIKVNEAAEAIKKLVFMFIIVENVEFSESMNSLRVSGKVLEGPEDVPKGSYHTFNLEEGSIITLIKEKWYSYQIEKIKDATESKIPKILICVFDREEAFIALMKRNGYDLLIKLKGDVARKRVEVKTKGSFYAEIIKILEEYDKRYGAEKIILASPAFWKEELFEELKNDVLKKKIVQATCSSVDETSINEVLKRDEVKDVLKQDRVSKEIKLVEVLFTNISKNDLAAYGINEVEKCAQAGAIEILLVTDNLIKKTRQENIFNKLEKIMQMVDNSKGKIIIISSEHQGGKKLDGLSGIGGILRYKLNY